jgi:membrane protease subunit HflC
MKLKKIFTILVLTVLAALVAIAGSMIFIVVDETEYVVVTRFGQVVRAYKNPGLKLKWPDPIETLYRYDNRLLIHEIGEVEFLPKDKKNIILSGYTVWRIDDPVKFLKTVKDEMGAEDKLSDIVLSELGIAVGNYDLASLVSTNPDAMQLDVMIDAITKKTDHKVNEYGMKAEEVRIKLLNFPQQNKEKVFRRMRAERERIARTYRAEGNAKAEEIRAQADEEREIIISAAYEQAERIKGEGDAEAIRIYADAYSKDPDFYKLVRTLQSYEKLIDKDTTIIMPADAELLRFINTANPEKQGPSERGEERFRPALSSRWQDGREVESGLSAEAE